MLRSHLHLRRLSHQGSLRSHRRQEKLRRFHLPSHRSSKILHHLRMTSWTSPQRQKGGGSFLVRLGSGTPELPRISRKKGIKSDSELDSLVKKVIKEAESEDSCHLRAAHLILFQGSYHLHCRGAGGKMLTQPRVRRQTGNRTSALRMVLSSPKILSPPRWEGRDLVTTDITSDDADQEMVDVDPATGSHLASGAKRKGRSVSHGAKKRAHPPPSPRTSSAGAKARSPPAKKIASSNKMPRSASPQPKK